MSAQLHLLNARGQFDGLQDRVQRCFSNSLELVANLIPVQGIDVIVYVDPDYVIPELGVSGFCTAADRLYIPIDPKHPEFNAKFEQRFLALFAHELHHCARRRISGYANNLGEALVTEGLACCFEAELPGGSVPFYATSLPPSQLAQMRDRAMATLAEPVEEWSTWFFGARPSEIPMYAGYAVGYAMVAPYLARSQCKASELWAEPAETFFAAASSSSGSS
jgi:uncharacterized protein YjaZ